MRTTYFMIKMILIIGIVSCSSNRVDKDSIMIKKVNQHPLLKDHDRQLIVKNTGIFNKKIMLYSDPGDGCNSCLCENDSSFILIDCNGEWYSIDKINGKIKDVGWRWGELPNDSIIGIFGNGTEKEYYEFSKSFDFRFKFKDPNIQ